MDHARTNERFSFIEWKSSKLGNCQGSETLTLFYFYLFLVENAGVEAGLSREDAKALSIQTCLGAAKIAKTSEDDLATLRRKVTSPKGTTEAAINAMEDGQIRKVMASAVQAAQKRSQELADLFGKQ
jgi:pyrroline-5-carboxylate reductase